MQEATFFQMSGGAVALLVSKRLPNTLRSLEEYRAGEYKEGLQKRSIEQATFRVKRPSHVESMLAFGLVGRKP